MRRDSSCSSGGKTEDSLGWSAWDPRGTTPRPIVHGTAAGAPPPPPPHITSPHITSPHLTSPHLTSPHLTSPHLTPICSLGSPTPLAHLISSPVTLVTSLHAIPISPEPTPLLITFGVRPWPCISPNCPSPHHSRFTTASHHLTDWYPIR